jgi:arylsulfatase A-like enzyme
LVQQPKDPKPALYDLDRDSRMEQDRAAEHPGVVERLREELEEPSLLAGRWRMVRDKRWKLIRIPDIGGARFELYDLEADPHETDDLAPAHPEVVRHLRASLEEWARWSSEEPAVVPRLLPMDERQIEEQLRALGYIE